MNYLNMVNQVLRRLREEDVSSLFENQQSTVVSSFVNDAKRHVENAHDWSDLRQDLTFATASGITTYSLLGSGNRMNVMDMRDVTNMAMLRQVPSSYIRRQETINSVGATRPSYYAFDGSDSNGDTQVRLWPNPDAIYTIKAFGIVRTDDLEAEGDEVTIPHQPIILLAHAMAAQERGDVSSVDVQSLYTIAQKSLGEHVMIDAGRNPDDMIWYPK